MKQQQIQTNWHYIYILLCDNNNYYTGYTTDLARRFQEHLLGTAKCKYTRSFKPLKIAQSWKLSNDKCLALKIEKFIKNLNKLQKQELILNPSILKIHFSEIQLN